MSEALTWVVASVIIILMTFVFIYISGIMGKTNFSFSTGIGKDSGFEKEQMLFAILQKKIENEDILSMIKEGKYNEVGVEVGKTLKDAENKGLVCQFKVIEDGREKINVGDSTGEEKSLIFDRWESVLKC